MKTVYVDNNATTAIAPEVLEAMQPYFTTDYFNPSSMYEAARSSAKAIQKARKTIADCLGGGRSRAGSVYRISHREQQCRLVRDGSG